MCLVCLCPGRTLQLTAKKELAGEPHLVRSEPDLVNRMTGNLGIELAEISAALVCPRPAQAVLAQEEIEAQVFLTDYCIVDDGEATDSR